jgi:hypothetical protein
MRATQILCDVCQAPVDENDYVTVQIMSISANGVVSKSFDYHREHVPDGIEVPEAPTPEEA